VGRYATIEGDKFWGVEREFEDLLTDPNVDASPVKIVAMFGFLSNLPGRK
jgi:hypothetical protein